MPRTTIPPTILDHEGAENPLVFTAADATNDMRYRNSGREIVLINNGGGVAVEVTFVAVPDEAGRAVNLVVTVAAGDIAAVDALEPKWWNQRAGEDQGFTQVDFDVDASVEVAVLRPA